MMGYAQPVIGRAFARPVGSTHPTVTKCSACLSQQPLPRHMVELQPDAIGILEQNRIVSRRPLILARRADDLGAELLEEAVQFIDVGALTGTEAEVMQTDALLF